MSLRLKSAHHLPRGPLTLAAGFSPFQRFSVTSRNVSLTFSSQKPRLTQVRTVQKLQTHHREDDEFKTEKNSKEI